jgi:SAM-dependent methyltransferase
VPAVIGADFKRVRAMRARLVAGRAPTPASFLAAITGVPARDRDAWMDVVWDAGEIPDDEPCLPRGCVPYLPCPVDTVLEALQLADVRPDDVVVDVGCGLGRTMALARLSTGAACIGIEIQPGLARAARGRAAWLNLSRCRVLEGDAVDLVRFVTIGTVFFFYCPFGGERLHRVLGDLEAIARTREIRICCVDLPLPACDWLAPVASSSADLSDHRSTIHATARVDA